MQQLRSKIRVRNVGYPQIYRGFSQSHSDKFQHSAVKLLFTRIGYSGTDESVIAVCTTRTYELACWLLHEFIEQCAYEFDIQRTVHRDIFV